MNSHIEEFLNLIAAMTAKHFGPSKRRAFIGVVDYFIQQQSFEDQVRIFWSQEWRLFFLRSS